MSSLFKVGLIINPIAGMGGPAGLKGSDHPDTKGIALSRGVRPKSQERVKEVLKALSVLKKPIEIFTVNDSMGEAACQASGLEYRVIHRAPQDSSAEDTFVAAKKLTQHGIDLLLFAGGDGTARDVFRAVGSEQAVLGLPAGVKMHSGVFAVTPKAVVSVIESLLSHKLVAARLAEVRDIDEEAFAKGKVKTRHYGEMLVPDDQLLVQTVKCSGLMDDELMLEELCAYLTEEMENDTLYILGSGGTLFHLKNMLGLESPTLLGVDLWLNGQMIARDVHEAQLFELLQRYDNAKLCLSIIGGQGIVLGRGNQQISPRVIEKVGLDNLQLVATQQKILALEGKPLRVDSGSDELDRKLSGFRKIICGYEDSLLYEVKYLE